MTAAVPRPPDRGGGAAGIEALKIDGTSDYCLVTGFNATGLPSLNYLYTDTTGNTNVAQLVGTGTPESVIEAGIGSTYLRLDGGTSTTLYVKETGTGNTGWVAK